MKVRLVMMPWASFERPSIALGTLVALARGAGVDCDVFYANLPLAAQLGKESYSLFSDNSSLFGLSEHLFACQAYGPTPLESDQFLERFGQSARLPLARLRDDAIPAYLDAIVPQILMDEPDIVGFSCTFNQVMASVAAAKRLRTLRHDIRLILGGACVHGEMGVTYAKILRDCFDHVFTGEADGTFVPALRAISVGVVPVLPGVTSTGVQRFPPIPFHDLESLPIPDYSEFARQRQQVLPELGTDFTIPFEGSRGCWWGEHSHCTFCGLNNEGMRFREKSPDRIHRELIELSQRHDGIRLMAADNIMSIQVASKLLAALEAEPFKFDLFFEIKANLTRSGVERLANAGVCSVQPGIESFSTDSLKRMRKGITAIQNVATLKWLTEYGIATIYNILIGFPGETRNAYDEMCALIPAIAHLTPPSGPPSQVEVHRFSPMHSSPREHGITSIRAARHYRHLFPADIYDESIAYFFEHVPECAPDGQMLDAQARLTEIIQKWIDNHSNLWLCLGPGFSCVCRAGDRTREIVRTLGKLATSILLVCDRPTSIDRIVCHLRGQETESTVRTEIDRLLISRLIIRERSAVLSVLPIRPAASQKALDTWLSRYASASDVDTQITSTETALPVLQHANC